MLRRRRCAVALVAWTFLVWTGRIGNIWRDDSLDTAGQLGRTALALSFTVLALGVVGALWRARPPLAVAVGALATWSVAVWAVRGVDIALADHALGFTVVHSLLAVASAVLAVLAWRETRRSQPGATTTADTAGRAAVDIAV